VEVKVLKTVKKAEVSGNFAKGVWGSEVLPSELLGYRISYVLKDILEPKKPVKKIKETPPKSVVGATSAEAWPTPPKKEDFDGVDIVVSFDTTGSMYPAIGQVRRNVTEKSMVG
jgi:hypothetical protein